MLKTVSFEIEITNGGVLAVTPHIDGISLATLVEAYEKAKGYCDPSGGYGGIIPRYFKYGPLGDYFTGRNPSRYFISLRGIYLLGCHCGEVGCWPLIAVVRPIGETFQWDRFSQPFRRARDYRAFGPFMFCRSQYEDAVRDLLVRLESADTALSERHSPETL